MPENIGHVIQIAGPAVDVQFVEATMPPIYQALKVVSDGFTVPTPINVILEVQQHLGEGRVRCVAMEPTDGMVRGMKASISVISPRPGPISSTVAPVMLPRASTMRPAASSLARKCWPSLGLRVFFSALPFDTLTLFLSGFRLKRIRNLQLVISN